MKKIIFLQILFIFTYSFAYSQNYFQTVIGEEQGKKESPINIIQNNENEYIICGWQKDTLTNVVGS